MMKDKDIPLISKSGAKRILVVDDLPLNHWSADELLGNRYSIDHAYTFFEAIQHLGYLDDWQYHEGHGKRYDYLLSDLNFPLVKKGLISPCNFVENRLTPFPNGHPLALIAARRNIPNIVIYTQADHHSDVAVGALDALLERDVSAPYGYARPILRIEDSRLAILDQRIEDVGWDWRYRGKQWNKAIDYFHQDD